jgi:hypothetical protein
MRLRVGWGVLGGGEGRERERKRRKVKMKITNEKKIFFS